jgi:hypothetical protein
MGAISAPKITMKERRVSAKNVSALCYTNYPNKEKEIKMTVSIEHNLKFVTDVDETHPVAQRLLNLTHEEQVQLLEGMLKALVAPVIQPLIDELNDNGTYAILKVVA